MQHTIHFAGFTYRYWYPVAAKAVRAIFTS
jgi:hypothetical protein